MKRTEPTRSLLQGGPYTKADHTDLRARFAAIRLAQQPAPVEPKYVVTVTDTGGKSCA